VVLAAGPARLTLLPGAGGRASSLAVHGLELIAHDADTAVGWGWYPMAPWPGRLRDNAIVFGGATHVMPVTHETWAIHGTVYNVPWTVETVRSLESPSSGRVATAVLSVALTDPWPWAGRVRQTWRLTETSVETELEVSSEGDAFPAEIGWHPWFRRRLDRGRPVVLDLPVQQMYERDAGHLPTGALVSPPPPGPYDDTFPLPGGEVGLTWPGALRLRCRTDCGYIVVYDERPDAICLEPQTAPPDGINVTPAIVRPGEPRRASAVWSWSLPDRPA
jgi:aldose 1-epimerase